MMASTADSPRPWYREPWPWFLISLPALAVVAGAVTLWLALKSDDGVIAADYYRQGLAINSELSRSTRAIELAIVAEAALDGVAPGDRVRIRLTAAQGLPPEPALQLRLVHPGRGGADRSAVLSRAAVGDDGRTVEYVGYFGDAAPVARPAAWQVVIETPSWRVDGRISAAEGRAFRLTAGR